MKSADQLRPPQPPDLKSELYARDYNETKDIGGAKSAKRTAEQAAAVKFWHAANLGSWQDVTRATFRPRRSCRLPRTPGSTPF